jgi:NAD(P)-dependent dehydrogenase (short-subunit alcohol dehydrogenase family)
VQHAVERVTPEFQGRLDILISNAGYMEPWVNIVDADVGEWWRSWDINIRGQFLLWQAMVPLVLADDSSLKTIVNMSSVGAFFVLPGASAYQTGKFALLRLTDFLNVEYGDQGLIAYCMHPGAVPTELSWKMPDFVKVNLIDTPELMADTVVYLTQKRREWLRGRYVSCNWDMPELLDMQDEIVEQDKLKMRMVV